MLPACALAEAWTSKSAVGPLMKVAVQSRPATDWNTPQIVTLTGQDDPVDDGDVAYTIVTGATSSLDPAYAGLDVDDVGVTNSDNDAAGIAVDPTSGLTTSEAGGTDQFTMVLQSQPGANVTITLSSSESSSAIGISFPTSLWPKPAPTSSNFSPR